MGAPMHRPIPKSICGQDDCATPYEFCEECVRTDEGDRIAQTIEEIELPVVLHQSDVIVIEKIAGYLRRAAALARTRARDAG